MPHIHHNQDVLHAHFLQQVEELLTGAFFGAILVTLLNELIILLLLSVVVVVVVELQFHVVLADAIGKDLGFRC